MTFGDPYSTMGWGSGGIVGTFMGLGNKGGGQGFNPANGLILCSTADFVCGLTPNIGGSSSGAKVEGTGGMGHISYSSDGSIPKAVTFITSKLG